MANNDVVNWKKGQSPLMKVHRFWALLRQSMRYWKFRYCSQSQLLFVPAYCYYRPIRKYLHTSPLHVKHTTLSLMIMMMASQELPYLSCRYVPYLMCDTKMPCCLAMSWPPANWALPSKLTQSQHLRHKDKIRSNLPCQ